MLEFLRFTVPIGGITKLKEKIVVCCVVIAIIGFVCFPRPNITDQSIIEQKKSLRNEHIAAWMQKVTESANCLAQDISCVWNQPIPDSTTVYEFNEALFSFESASIQNAIDDAYALATSVKENALPGFNPHMISISVWTEERNLDIHMLRDTLPEKSELESQVLQALEDNSTVKSPEPIIIIVSPEALQS